MIKILVMVVTIFLFSIGATFLCTQCIGNTKELECTYVVYQSGSVLETVIEKQNVYCNKSASDDSIYLKLIKEKCTKYCENKD